MIRDHAELLGRIRSIHAAIRDDVLAASQQMEVEQLAAVVAEEAGDTIFAIDRISELDFIHLSLSGQRQGQPPELFLGP
ncbi:MAG TPA: hypothetical protein VLA19_23135 [Herpetosiphonaceae bacterium]|nr:hypothetical protein [Herpetosiphonaceae bacterium]